MSPRTMFSSWLLFAVALAHPVAAGRAEAHPGGAVLGQRVDVVIGPEEGGLAVEVRYVAELPMVRLYAEARTPDLPAGAPPSPEALAAVESARLVELRDGLSARWGGEKVPLDVISQEAAAGDEGFRELRVVHRGHLAGATGELRVVNGNFPDEGGFFATSFHLDGALVATGTNLASVREGRLRDNRHAAWVRDEATRESWVALRPARAWEEGEPGPVTGRLAGLDELSFPVRGVGGVVGGGLLAAGAWVWWRGRSRGARS